MNEAERGDVIRQLLQANRILCRHGVLDAFGHVSVRSPAHPDRFLMSRSMAPALVREGDIVEHDLDGRPVSEPGARVFLERFIHAAIYRRRAEVAAIVHSHCPAVIPFTVVPASGLRPICHLCGFLGGVAAPFDVAVRSGSASDLLIRNAELGHALAEHLADAEVVLMRGHGYTTVGEHIPQAVFRAVYTAVNAQVQLAASTLGAPVFLSTEEARACERTTSEQLDRAWDLWVRQLDQPQVGECHETG